MGTGVVVNGYEIRNWHTVSILELSRARKEQARGREVATVVEAKKSKGKTNRRSKDMPRELLISEEKARELNRRYLAGESLPEISGEYGVTHFTAINYFKRYGLTYPRPKAGAAEVSPTPDEPLAITTPGDDEQMDEPEAVVAAASTPTPEPPPSDEDVLTLARSRARELHINAGDSRVIAVQELTPVLARKQYSVPRILESGSLLNIGNPHAAAKLVENLVAELNQVPGVQAYFEWRSEGRMGQPLAR